jgi:hypothetical protein
MLLAPPALLQKDRDWRCIINAYAYAYCAVTNVPWPVGRMYPTLPHVPVPFYPGD